MNSLKKIVNFISILSILILTNSTVFAEDNSVQNSTKSIVRVITSDKKQLSLGSGFAIGKTSPVQYFATNNHVIESNYNQVYIIYSDKEPILADVLVYNKKKDLAILKVSKPIKDISPMVFADTKKVTVTEKIHTLGFPALYDVLNFEAGLNKLTAKSDDVTVGTGTINRKDTINGTIMYIHDSKISEGNSGGPLVNDSAEVIGINTLLRGTNVVYSESVSIDELISLLNEKNLDYQVSTKTRNNNNNSSDTNIDKSTTEDNSSSMSMKTKVIIFVIFVFFILTLITIIILIKIFKSSSKNSQISTSSDNIYSNRNSQGKTNQNKFDANQNSSVLTPDNVDLLQDNETVFFNDNLDMNATYSKTVVLNLNIEKILLECLNGHFKGKTFELSNKPMVLGRSKSKSTLVFPDNFTDISGVHCVIEYNEFTKKIYITDKSTNGTFFKNGDSFEKGIAIEIGLDVEFYLSTEQNSFRFIQNKPIT